MKLKILFLITIIFITSSCSKNKNELEKITITEKNIENQIIEAYEEGLKEL